jgi:hypothetical protein
MYAAGMRRREDGGGKEERDVVVAIKTDHLDWFT